MEAHRGRYTEDNSLIRDPSPLGMLNWRSAAEEVWSRQRLLPGCLNINIPCRVGAGYEPECLANPLKRPCHVEETCGTEHSASLELLVCIKLRTVLPAWLLRQEGAAATLRLLPGGR